MPELTTSRPGRSAGLFWNLTTDTDIMNVLAGQIGFSNSNLTLATTVYIHPVDGDGINQNGFIQTWDDSTSPIRGRIEIRNDRDPTQFILYNITGPIASPGLEEAISLTVTYSTSSGLPFTDGTRVNVNFVRAGNTGSPGGTGAAGAGYAATSTSSLAIGIGSKVFGTSGGLAYSAGARIRATSASEPTKWMEGVVTDYSGGNLTVTIDRVGVTGTKADWNINLAGEPGTQMVAYGRLLDQTTAQDVVIYTVPADGSYEIGGQFFSVSGSGDTINMKADYTDETNVARTQQFIFTRQTGTTASAVASLGTAQPWSANPCHIRVKGGGGQTIKIYTSGTFGTAHYNVEGYIRQLQ